MTEDIFIKPFVGNNNIIPSYHLYPLRINGLNENMRAEVLFKMMEKGIYLNVHYKPLYMMSAYKKMGYKDTHYPNCSDTYVNEISLPVYSTLSINNARKVVNELKTTLKDMKLL